MVLFALARAGGDLAAGCMGAGQGGPNLGEILKNLGAIKLNPDLRAATRSACLSERGRGLALASRFPPVPDSRICQAEDGLLAVQVITPEGPVWLVSIHLHWPYPIDQAAQVKRIVPVLEKLTGPVILAGDFNMVPWSYTMTRIEDATRTQRVGRTNGTFLLEDRMMLPIDHVLVPSACGGDVSTLDLLGSDHHGVLASLSLKRCH